MLNIMFMLYLFHCADLFSFYALITTCIIYKVLLQQIIEPLQCDKGMETISYNKLTLQYVKTRY